MISQHKANRAIKTAKGIFSLILQHSLEVKGNSQRIMDLSTRKRIQKRNKAWKCHLWTSKANLFVMLMTLMIASTRRISHLVYCVGNSLNFLWPGSLRFPSKRQHDRSLRRTLRSKSLRLRLEDFTILLMSYSLSDWSKRLAYHRTTNLLFSG
jgi:hypothetical protein